MTLAVIFLGNISYDEYVQSQFVGTSVS